MGLFPKTSASVTLCSSSVTNLFWKPFSLHLFRASKPINFPLFGCINLSSPDSYGEYSIDNYFPTNL